MKFLKKATAILLSVIMISVFFCTYSFSASRKITSLKIITAPDKTVFYKNTDWVYGEWITDESKPGKCSLVSNKKISFTHNPGGGTFGERGMIDMTGLVIEVSYSDGTKNKITYKETKLKSGYYSANILSAPKGGKEFFIGKNTIEVYLAEDTSKYDSYTIDITDKEKPGSTEPDKPEAPENKKEEFFLLRWAKSFAQAVSSLWKTIINLFK